MRNIRMYIETRSAVSVNLRAGSIPTRESVYLWAYIMEVYILHIGLYQRRRRFQTMDFILMKQLKHFTGNKVTKKSIITLTQAQINTWCYMTYESTQKCMWLRCNILPSVTYPSGASQEIKATDRKRHWTNPNARKHMQIYYCWTFVYLFFM